MPLGPKRARAPVTVDKTCKSADALRHGLDALPLAPQGSHLIAPAKPTSDVKASFTGWYTRGIIGNIKIFSGRRDHITRRHFHDEIGPTFLVGYCGRQLATLPVYFPSNWLAGVLVILPHCRC